MIRMLQKAFFSIALLLVLGANINAQNLVSYEFMRTENPSLFEALLPGLISQVSPNFPLSIDSVNNVINAQYQSDVYKVTYKTTHPVLGEINATGAIAIPKDVNYECGMPMAIYQHGTTFNTEGVPSYNSLEINFGTMLAADGYVTILPDYMGLGDSPGMHPYVHGPTQALAAIDLMRATRQLQDSLDFDLNGQNFIFGYSQGGHGAMSLFYELETNYADEFEATAAAPMSGPYNITDIQQGVMFLEYATPRYLPYTLIGYQSVYPSLREQFPAPFKEEWGALNNFDGDSDEFFAIMNTLDIPAQSYQIFTEELLTDFILNPNHPLKQKFRENDYYDWEPKAPLLIMGCCDDEQVMIQNLYYTRDVMEEKGLDNFEAIDWCDEYPDSAPFGHNGCIPYCLIKGKTFFDGLRTDCNETATSNTEIVENNFSVSPNPTEGLLQIETTLNYNIIDQVKLYNINGQVVSNTLALNNNNAIDISSFPNGFYILEIRTGDETEQIKIVKQVIFVYYSEVLATIEFT